MASPNGVVTSPTLLRDLRDPAKREEAWCTFLERYCPMVRNWCCRMGLRGHDVEDVSAGVMAKLAKVMSTFVYDPTRHFRGWLHTLVQNEVYALWRQRKHRPGDWASGDPLVHGKLQEVEAPACMDEFVRALDETLERGMQQAYEAVARVRARVADHTWQAYWQTAIEGQPGGAVARRLGIKVATVYVAKKRVGRMLREEGARIQAQAEHGKGGEP